MKDFIIVGRGLAATCLMHQFHKYNIGFEVIGNTQLSLSSQVAAGIWNPVVFKRLTSSWMNEQLIPSLEQFYTDCEKNLNQKLITQRTLIKPFTEDQEKTLWKRKAETELSNFLDPVIYSANSTHRNLKIVNQFGLVKQAGNLDIKAFIEASSVYFNNFILDEVFEYDKLIIENNFVQYKNIKAQNIIFCEGYLVKNNPFFQWIPLVPAKGETLTIKTSELSLREFIFNRDGFMMDLSEDTFKVGATYEWQNLNASTSEAGLQSLKNKIQNISTCNYKILSHVAGVRPSSIDRRPIIGMHPKHKQLFIFNGLGAKGVMLAPFFTENFVHFYQQNQKLQQEVDVKRFYHLYESFAHQ